MLQVGGLLILFKEYVPPEGHWGMVFSLPRRYSDIRSAAVGVDSAVALVSSAHCSLAVSSFLRVSEHDFARDVSVAF